MAKSGLLEILSTSIPDFCITAIMTFAKRVQTQQWRHSWNNTFQGRNCYTNHPDISSQPTFLSTNRGQQTLMSRLRLGRVSLNYPQFLTQHHPKGL